MIRLAAVCFMTSASLAACAPLAGEDDSSRDESPVDSGDGLGRDAIRFTDAFIDGVDAVVTAPDDSFWLARRVKPSADELSHSVIGHYDAARTLVTELTTAPGETISALALHPSGAVTALVLKDSGASDHELTLRLLRLGPGAEIEQTYDAPADRTFLWDLSASLAPVGEDAVLHAYAERHSTLTRFDSQLRLVWTTNITPEATDTLLFYGMTTLTAASDGTLFATNKLDAADVDAFNDLFDASLTAFGERDVVVSAFSSDGEPLYHTLIGTSAVDGVHATTLAGDRLVLVGDTLGKPEGDKTPDDLWISWLDASSGVRYAERTYDLDREDHAVAVTALPGGTVVVGGKTGFVQVKTGSIVEAADAFVFGLGADGTEMFRQTFGTDRDDIVTTLAPLTGGRVLAAGVLAGPITHDGDAGPAGRVSDGFVQAFEITP